MGLIVIEGGATASFVGLENNQHATIWVCAEGTCNLLSDTGSGGYGGSNNGGMIVVESEGTLYGDATSGLGVVLPFLGANISGNANGLGGSLDYIIYAPFVRKSSNYPTVADVVANAAGAFSAGLGKFGTYDDLVGIGTTELATLNTQKAKIANGQTITLSGGVSQAGTAAAGAAWNPYLLIP
jgi:hypothetical protein